MSRSSVRAARCFLVWLGTSVLLLGVTWFLARDLIDAVAALRTGGLADRSFDTLLVWWCSLVMAACCLWWWLSSTLVILTAARGRPRTALPGYPALVRRIVLVACGLAVVGSMISPANAVDSNGDRRPAGHTSGSPSLIGLPLPERAVRHHQVVRTPQARVVPVVDPTPDTRHVSVRSGDTLWSIAARSLAPTAGVATINDRWHEIYALNRGVIGSDPDLILPGQQLRLDQA